MTHRCHGRELLLKFDIDRRQYRERLLEASHRFRRLRFLDYTITSNHVHLLLWVPRMADLSAMMKWLQGTFALDYNRRKKREGAFWRGRFHPTLVQTGSHLSRCLFYMDMNMVRAGVVGDPVAWRFGGARELAGVRQRYRIVDRDRLLWCLGMPGEAEAFDKWYCATLQDLCARQKQPREPYWGSALAVGSTDWLARLAGGREDLAPHMHPVGSDADGTASDSHALRVPQDLFLRIWGRLGRGSP